MEKSEIIRHLKDYLSKQTLQTASKKDLSFWESLRSVDEETILFGDPPTYFFAQVECNSTGVGESSFEGTKTRRTIARDYTTDEHLFVDGHVGAGEKGLSLFFLKEGQTINYYPKSDIVKVAKEYGFQLHLQYFKDLNFRLTDHRLNRHTINITRKPFSYPIRPIFAVVSEKGDKATIGYVYEMDGVEYIIIEPQNPSAIQKENPLGLKPWMLLSFLFPPLLIVVAFVMLTTFFKKRWRG